MRGLGGWIVFAGLLFVGCFDLVVAVMGFARGWFVSSGKWMGVGPWFQYALTLQNAAAGAAALLSAYYWLRDRDDHSAMVGGGFAGALGGFLGPTHEPIDPSVAGVSWFRYALALFMLILGCTTLFQDRRNAKEQASSPSPHTLTDLQPK